MRRFYPSGRLDRVDVVYRCVEADHNNRVAEIGRRCFGGHETVEGAGALIEISSRYDRRGGRWGFCLDGKEEKHNDLIVEISKGVRVLSIGKIGSV